jgi:hypothetical protein
MLPAIGDRRAMHVMSIQDTTTPGIRPGPALLLMTLLWGCGGAGSGQDQAAATAPPTRPASAMPSAALQPVERPVARPMDRGASGQDDPVAVPPVERPVAKPMDRTLAEPGQGS